MNADPGGILLLSVITKHWLVQGMHGGHGWWEQCRQGWGPINLWNSVLRGGSHYGSTLRYVFSNGYVHCSFVVPGATSLGMLSHGELQGCFMHAPGLRCKLHSDRGPTTLPGPSTGIVGSDFAVGWLVLANMS